MFILKKIGLNLSLLVLFNLIISTNCYSQTPGIDKLPDSESLGALNTSYINFYKQLPSDKKSLNELLIRTCVRSESEEGLVPEIILMINKGADINLNLRPYQSVDSPLVCAIKHGTIKQMQWLLDHGAEINPKDPYMKPLLNALKTENTEKIKFLLDHGADPNGQGSFGDTPLILINCLGTIHTEKMHFKKAVEIAKILIEHGADVNEQAGTGNDSISGGSYPLTEAAQNGNLELVRLLLKHGADVNLKSQEISIPLHEALFARNYDVAKELIANGAIIRDKTIRCDTTLIALLEPYLSINGNYTEEDRFQMAKLLIDKGVDVNQQGRIDTALTCVIKKGYKTLVELLLKNGVKVTDSENKELIIQALGNSYSISENEEALNNFTKNPFKRNAKKITSTDQLEIVKLLIQYGLSIKKEDLYKMRYLYPEVVDYLNSVISEPLTEQELASLKKKYKEGISNNYQYQAPVKTTKKQPANKTSNKQPPKQTSKKKAK